jgi:hypothetical protein
VLVGSEVVVLLRPAAPVVAVDVVIGVVVVLLAAAQVVVVLLLTVVAALDAGSLVVVAVALTLLLFVALNKAVADTVEVKLSVALMLLLADAEVLLAADAPCAVVAMKSANNIALDTSSDRTARRLPGPRQCAVLKENIRFRIFLLAVRFQKSFASFRREQIEYLGTLLSALTRNENTVREIITEGLPGWGPSGKDDK